MRRSPIPPAARLLARLSDRDSLSVSELAQPFAMSLPAIMKHLDVLSDAGLIVREKTGRMVACRLTATADGAGDGLAQSLPAFLVRKPRPPCRLCGGRTMAQSVGSPAHLDQRPSLTITRRLRARPQKVYAAWTDPRKSRSQWFGPTLAKPGSVQADLDVRVGGRYRISSERDGEYFEVGGLYREVVPNARLDSPGPGIRRRSAESLVTIAQARAARHADDTSTMRNSPRDRARCASARMAGNARQAAAHSRLSRHEDGLRHPMDCVRLRDQYITETNTASCRHG